MFIVEVSFPLVKPQQHVEGVLVDRSGLADELVEALIRSCPFAVIVDVDAARGCRRVFRRSGREIEPVRLGLPAP
jgi:hypothetical protein